MEAYRNMKELRELLYFKQHHQHSQHSDLFAYINQPYQSAARINYSINYQATESNIALALALVELG